MQKAFPVNLLYKRLSNSKGWRFRWKLCPSASEPHLGRDNISEVNVGGGESLETTLF